METRSAPTGNGDLLAQAMRQAFKDVSENEAEALQADVRDAGRPNKASGTGDAPIPVCG